LIRRVGLKVGEGFCTKVMREISQRVSRGRNWTREPSQQFPQKCTTTRSMKGRVLSKVRKYISRIEL